MSIINKRFRGAGWLTTILLVLTVSALPTQAAATEPAADKGQVVYSGTFEKQSDTAARKATPGANRSIDPHSTYVTDISTLKPPSGARQAAVTKALNAPVANAAGYDVLDFGRCVNNPQNSQQPGGWVLNHFSWCESLTGIQTASRNGVEFARVTFRATVLGFTSNASRNVSLNLTIDAVVFAGTEFQGKLMTLAWSSAAYPASTKCQLIGAPYSEQHTFADWNNRTEYSGVVSDPTTDTDKKGSCTFRPWLYLNDSGVYSTDVFDGTGARCDSATYLATAQGCIFDRITPSLAYSKAAGSDVRSVALHIEKAIKTPALTIPKASGKFIPGGSTASLIHRSIDSKKNTANRTKSRATCLREIGTYDGSKLNCDEFPFASAMEGSAQTSVNYSVQVIDRTQNQRAGNNLGVWLGRDRILAGDGYYVLPY